VREGLMNTEADFWPLTNEQRMIQEEARRFAQREVMPVAKELDESMK
jgi:hypothetical protein